MASINFVDQTTVVPASWLNDVNALVYTVFGGTVSVPSAGKIFRSNGTAMVASTSTFADTYGINTILYASSANAVTGLATVNNSVLSTGATGVPTWLTAAASSILVTNGSSLPSLGTAIPNGITATTQATHDNSTKVATTAYVDGLVPQAATAGNILLDSGTVWTSAPMTSTGFRNRIINGDMRIDQANEGASVTVNSASQFFGPDMWCAFGTVAAGVFTLQRLSATPPAGFTNYLRIQTATADAAPAAGSTYLVDYRIEGLNVVDFQLGTAGAVQFTTSMQMRSSLTGTFSGSFMNKLANRSYPWTCTINSANTWTPVVVTLTGDTAGSWNTDNNIGLIFRIDIGSGSTFRSTAGTWQAGQFNGVTGAVRLISTLNATLDITGVQIEKGAVATPFEVRGFQEELARCWRYYYKTFNLGTKPAQASGTAGMWNGMCVVATTVATHYWDVRFPVSMRVGPTVTYYNPANANAQIHDYNSAADFSNTGAGNIGNNGMTLFGNSDAGCAIAGEIGVQFVLDSRL